jgi:hypothetical protein
MASGWFPSMVSFISFVPVLTWPCFEALTFQELFG